MKKVGIIGSGAVGKALAKGFLKYGYDVTIASRSEEKQAALKAEIGGGIKASGFAETAKNADLVVLAVKGSQAKSALEICGIDNFTGKTVIDTSNPIKEGGPEKFVLKYFTSLDHSLMEELQNMAPKANFVKSFSSVGSPAMVDPDFNGQKPTMFICGNSEQAKAEAIEFLTKFNWEVEDMGGVEAARAIEPLAMLWCIPGFKNNQWTHAFKLLKK